MHAKSDGDTPAYKKLVISYLRFECAGRDTAHSHIEEKESTSRM